MCLSKIFVNFFKRTCISSEKVNFAPCVGCDLTKNGELMGSLLLLLLFFFFCYFRKVFGVNT
jgi:hypothetical protein